ncbi:signal recognition particle protein [Mycoplasma iguanae]|uniref:Signal recognition particle protein n=1 Tax=Mycoplasma iguanae TaxID=292461 RepID=A0ABY5RBB1_9MOLU|nr:signal recognition particle protein [Mycoplasma iguanae]UVD81900.1 signal recognition particle protein [Mycoplasma iguanae]
MLDFLGKRLQKAMNSMSKKTVLTEEDIVVVTREIRLALLEADVNLNVVKSFIKNIKEQVVGSEIVGKLNPEQQMIKIVHQELKNILGGKTQEVTLNSGQNIFMMVGLQGTGKTTSAAKIANYFLTKKQTQKPLLIAADTYRPAAIEQLKILAKNINVEVYSEHHENKPEDIVARGIEYAKANNYDLIIIDTAGRISINAELMEELVKIKKIAKPQEIIFVTDALVGQDIINVAEEFHNKLTLSSLVITKLDSDARGGAALSLRQLLNVPIKFIGTGEKSSNLDLFHPNRMADRILGMGDVLSLIEQADQVIDKEKTKKITNRMLSGQFDLDDLLESLKQMRKLGKMSKLLKMVPGLATKAIDQSKIDAAEQKIKLFEILLSSMTQKERKNPKLLKNAARKDRIIKGSGRSNQEYNTLINEFEKMSKQMQQFGQLFKKGGTGFNPGSFNGMF